MGMFEDLIKTINELKLNAPPKREIWLTSSAPYKDDKGELVIVELDVDYMRKDHLFNIAPLQTVTGADRVILMNPMTFDHLKDSFEVPQLPNQIISSVYGIPVFDDEYRREFFKNKQENKNDGKET